MSFSHPVHSLRNILLVDAVTCAAMGALLAFGSGPIGGLTAIPPALLFCAGLSLFPIAAFMAVVATRRVIRPAAARLVVVGNVLWVAGSALLLASGWIAPNPLGVAFVAGQALAVAGLAWLEHAALGGARMALRAG